jgi:hypothetical protein
MRIWERFLAELVPKRVAYVKNWCVRYAGEHMLDDVPVYGAATTPK